MRKAISVAALALLFLFSGTALRAQVLFDFETSGQWTGNFRKITTASLSANLSVAQTSNGASNDYVTHENKTGSSSTPAFLYDSTPADTTSATDSVFSTAGDITVSLDFRAAAATSSIGIYFADPSNYNNNLLCLFTLDASSTTDTFRAWRDGTVAAGSASPGTQVGSTANFATSVASAGSPTFTSLAFKLSVSGSTPTLSLTSGSQTSSQVFSSGDFDFLGSNAVVMVRMNDGNINSTSAFDFDNFQIQAVPEPSAWLLLSAGLALLVILERRRRNAPAEFRSVAGSGRA